MIRRRQSHLIVLDPTLNTNGLLVLQNPATVNGNDNTVRLINTRFRHYFNGIGTLYIVNIVSVVGTRLDSFESVDADELFAFEDANINYITDLLQTTTFTKIIVACGQHFTTSWVPIHRTRYIQQYRRVINILRFYANIVYCLGISGTLIDSVLLPLHLNARNLNDNRYSSILMRWYF
jgi:hypothetical protein